MAAINVILASVVLLWLQTCILGPLAMVGLRPDLLLILVVFLALYGEDEHWPARYWAVGLLKDIFALGPLGLHAFFFLVVGILVEQVRGEIFREHFVNRALLVFAGVLVGNGLPAMAQSLLLRSLAPLSLAGTALSEAACSAAVAPLLIPVLLLFRGSLGIRDPRDLSRVV